MSRDLTDYIGSRPVTTSDDYDLSTAINDTLNEIDDARLCRGRASASNEIEERLDRLETTALCISRTKRAGVDEMTPQSQDVAATSKNVQTLHVWGRAPIFATVAGLATANLESECRALGRSQKLRRQGGCRHKGHSRFCHA